MLSSSNAVSFNRVNTEADSEVDSLVKMDVQKRVQLSKKKKNYCAEESIAISHSVKLTVICGSSII